MKSRSILQLFILMVAFLSSFNSKKAFAQAANLKTEFLSSTSNKATSLAKVQTKTKSKLPPILAEVYNVDDIPATLAITQGRAKVARTEAEAEGLFTPQLVNHITDDPPAPKLGPLESIEENPTINEYYDGSLHLNVIKVDCKVYQVKGDCIHNAHCGWCGSRNGCVLGNLQGPGEPCVKSSYIYGKPYPNYTPQVKTINEAVGGVTNTIINNMN